jgi:benzoyl-CoA reductase/2-hydroxyglutaryl-CoA dehydratase subunit BcrC/BadD/HgdB
VQDPCVVVAWPSVPVEIVRAAGFRPMMSRGASGPTPAADVHLEPGIFPSRLRWLVEDALTGRLTHAARIVIPRTSDPDYKCFLYLREFVRRGVVTTLAPVVLFDLLQSRGPDVPAYDVARMHGLLEELSSVSGRIPSADDLRREIIRMNTARSAARRLVELRRPVPRVAGAKVFPLLAAVWEMDPDRYVEMASDAAKRIAARPPLAGPRVLLTGAPVDSHTLHETIESHGAVVVDEVGPWGSGAAGEDVRIDDDPVAALAHKYRADSVGARTPVDSLRQWTESMLNEVDAVVVSLPPDDAVFGWDYPVLRDVLQTRGIPHVCLRGDPYETSTPAEHAALDAMVSAASPMPETRRG